MTESAIHFVEGSLFATRDHLGELGVNVPVVHVVELIHSATGGPLPESLRRLAAKG